MKRLAFATILALAVLTISRPSHATPGASFGGCWTSTDGSGYCYGTMYWWGNTPGNSASMNWDYANFGWFQVQYNNKNYSCTTNSTLMGNAFALAVNSRGEFFVSWDANGTCSSVYLYNGASYQDF
jgi:hypothetical protein